MASTAATAPVPDGDTRVDATGILIDDVPCFVCGYNLRAASRQATCPECGRPVVDSLKHSDMSLADATWLRALAAGTIRLVVAMIAVVPAFLFEFMMPLGSIFWGLPPVVMPGALVILSVGCWRLTRPEPDRLVIPGNRTRLAVRGLGVAMGLLGLLSIVMLLAGWLLSIDQLFYTAVLPLLGAMPLALALLPCLNVYLRRLARRASMEGLAKQTTLALHSLLVTSILLVVMLIGFVILAALSIGAAFGGGPSPVPDAVLALVGIALLGVTLIAVGLYIWSIVLLIWYARVFRRMARLSEARQRPGSSTSTDSQFAMTSVGDGPLE